MRGKSLKLLSLLVSLALACVFALGALAAQVPRITKEELKARLGSPDLIILDVRTSSDWGASDFKIKGAIREDFDKVDSWPDNYPKDKTIVLYCG